ncbi:2,3-bisphosphoglycerate-independent phosphoglycerate mutase [Methanosarcina mazei]|uniref:2,3-bisphosphoglycerate-independent phosphoglycerate mutase n=3 Tax=Methanosarcina mazei TaxID=2209 RepID=A0A0F8N9B5_METMZ|nr:2,3-bisphosphoglycerate-independent phosphoglycerate mutase [Methanosarcina mazei]AGF96324.1 2,3-bisphosphoglycerate-independent phosphoglycerate mutase [Methanosarcina mazei Tuc01]AKB70310.1 2,3-bisphosphoglycerate-independent phosphoglycerate mutase [Methanosarcina mazei C16]KKG03042.1 phosphoglyceromutase [Methanosarcina mazei]KKG03590.1 phosphoglyceromutase [Methanosarcina mazei]KKG11942.1 phosphoglyceromutase [Methanosarcina mazei]
MTQARRPLMLMILDGWGYREEKEGNAILAASTPHLDRLQKERPSCFLETSGEAVGLPQGQMGNSEVGHLNIGAGRVVYQDLTKINVSIRNGDFFENPVLLDAISNVKLNNSSLHLMGLVSYGGVHSHMTHLYALIKLAQEKGLKKVYIHVFLDGRDVPPKAALGDVKELDAFCKENQSVKIATVQGRYYAMDRDKRWERTKLAYDALTLGVAPYKTSDAVTAVSEAYERVETDEFIKPTIVTDSEGNPEAVIQDTDSIVFFNFRPDRARQLTWAFVKDDFEGFTREKRPKVHYVCMAQYDETLDLPIAFPPEELTDVLGKVLSDRGLIQLRIAETEKYAHVTFFLNGGQEKCYSGEDRCLIPSPKISTYDLKPEMSAYEVTDEVVKRILSGKYDVIILNFANMDMVGHTGDFEAAVKAVETVDNCVGRIVEALRTAGGAALITADHGNAEQMENSHTGEPHTAHTSNPVKCIYTGNGEVKALENGKLSDLAPTLLDLLEIPKPEKMTGRSLIVRK